MITQDVFRWEPGWISDINLVQVADIIRDVYFERSTWETAIKKCFTENCGGHKTYEQMPETNPLADALRAKRKWRVRV